VRATPFYWRVHAFGTRGNAEVLGETEIVLRLSGRPPERRELAPTDSLRAELEAFADATRGRTPFPVTTAQMLDTVSAFERVVSALEG
jgi:predicted dehydrogenase